MKKFILAIALLVGFASAQAGLVCRDDGWGNQVCTDDSGFQSKTYRDQGLGQKYEDTQGNRWTCRKGVFGGTVCN